MKRLFALVLAVAILLSMCVLPASAAEQSKMSVASFSTFTFANNVVTIGSEKASYEKDDLIAVKVSFHNADELMYIMSMELRMNYDDSMVEPYTWKRGTATLGYAVWSDLFKTDMSSSANKIEDGIVKISGASAYGVEIAKDATVDVAYFLFKVKDEVETGNAVFSLTINNLRKQGEQAGQGIEIGSDVTLEPNQAPLTGKAPTLGSVTISPEATTVFASGKEFALSAMSASGKDITSLVTFKIQKDGKDFTANAGFTIDGNKLTVASSGLLANVGTYTVVAEADGTKCIGSASAVFTITPKTITTPEVTVTGFGKGAVVSEVKYSVENLHTVSTWYEGTGNLTELTLVDSTGKFKADTTYTLVLTLTPTSDNYKLDESTTVTVIGLGDEQFPTLTANDDGTYSATVTAKTGEKDTPTVTMNPISATFGDKLSSIAPTGTAKYGEETVSGTYAWENPDQTVGNVGTNTIYAVFTPIENEKYSAVTAPVTVTVSKKVITFSASDYEWTAAVADDESADGSTMSFGYNGKPHGVKLRVNNTSIQDFVTIAYQLEGDATSTTAPTKINADSYNTTAVIDVADKANCELQVETGKNPTISYNWTIAKGKLSIDEKTIGVRFGTSSLTVTPEQLGLPTGENFTVTYPTTTVNTVIQSMSASGENMVFTLKSTTADDVDKYDVLPLTYSSANYEDVTISLKITIINKNIDESTVSISGPKSVEYGTAYDFTYLGVPDDAELKSTAYTNTVASETSATKPEAVGSYKISCTWESSTTIYKAEYEFAITARDISKAAAAIADLTYTGEEQTASLTVTDGEKTLTLNTDYTVDEASLKKTNANTYTVIITGKGNYTGKMEKEYQILPCNISTVTVEAITAQTYTGSAITPEPVVKHGSTPLEKGKDYTVSYANNENAGTATVTINGTGNYTGTKTVEFTINQLNISETAAVDPIADVTYTGSAITPEPVVKYGSTTLEKGKDYTVSYEDNTNAGTATVKIAFTGNYTGEKSVEFNIGKKRLESNIRVVTPIRYNDLTEHTLDLTQYLQGVPASSITCSVDEYENDIVDVTPENDAAGKWTGKVRYRLKKVETYGRTWTYGVSLDYGGNYEPQPVVINAAFDITDKANQAALTYTGATSVVYPNSIQLSAEGGTTSNAITYTVDSTKATITNGVLTPKCAGDITLTISRPGNDEYLDVSTSVTIHVAQGTPADPTYTKIETDGKTLADVNLTFTLPGSVLWTDKDGKILSVTTKVEADKEYFWTFTPDDSGYKQTTGKLVPYVRDDLSWLPGVINGGSNFTFHDVNRFDYYYDSVKWAADNGIASGTSRFAFSPDAVCTRAQTVTFLWRAAGSPLPRYRACPFTDVQANDYYYEAVLWAVEQGITTGLTATTFGPDETVTRGQVATFLYRAASAAKPNTFNPFTDVKTTAYNFDAILWAYDNRITTGTSTTTFSPDAFCTRAQIVTFLYRYYQGR